MTKPKILILGPHANFNSEMYLKESLEALGCDVIFLGYYRYLASMKLPANVIRMAISRYPLFRGLCNNTILRKFTEKVKRCLETKDIEVLITLKGELPPKAIIEWANSELGIKTVLWYPDDPRYFNTLVRFIAPSYSHIFTTSQTAIKAYKEIGCNRVFYLPSACYPPVHRKVTLSRHDYQLFTTNICFVGTYYPKRGRIIKALMHYGVRTYGPYWRYLFRSPNVIIGPPLYGPQMVKAFNASKIVLNIHHDSDVYYKTNTRTFEVTGSGGFLLTDKTVDLHKLYSVGREVVCYDDVNELIELVKYFLDNPDQRAEIAKAGFIRAHRFHTYKHRALEILKTIGFGRIG